MGPSVRHVRAFAASHVVSAVRAARARLCAVIRQVRRVARNGPCCNATTGVLRIVHEKFKAKNFDREGFEVQYREPKPEIAVTNEP